MGPCLTSASVTTYAFSCDMRHYLYYKCPFLTLYHLVNNEKLDIETAPNPAEFLAHGRHLRSVCFMIDWVSEWKSESQCHIPSSWNQYSKTSHVPVKGPEDPGQSETQRNHNLLTDNHNLCGNPYWGEYLFSDAKLLCRQLNLIPKCHTEIFPRYVWTCSTTGLCAMNRRQSVGLPIRKNISNKD